MKHSTLQVSTQHLQPHPLRSITVLCKEPAHKLADLQFTSTNGDLHGPLLSRCELTIVEIYDISIYIYVHLAKSFP